ncbi:MAG: hypothetical protein ACK5MZ_01545 [Aestuariibaculum sp.]
MPYLSSIHINTEKNHPYPFNVPAVKYAKHIELPTPIIFLQEKTEVANLLYWNL